MMTISEMNDIDISMYRLPEKTMQIIHTLNTTFKGVSERQHHKPYVKYENKTEKTPNSPDTDVSKPSAPQLTKFHTVYKRQADVGIQRDVKEITLLMNKMTDKNYDKISNDLFESLEYVMKEYAGNSELVKITDNLNNIIKFNSAYSTIYSKFYKLLIEKYGTLFVEGLEKINVLFEETMTNIWCVDPDEDYDKYCKSVQENKTRKSLLIFIVKLVMNGYYDVDLYSKYFDLVSSKVKDYINTDNSTRIVEELGELLYDMIVIVELDTLKSYHCWEKIEKFVQEMKGLAPKDMKSFSMRCKFKYMDINDYLIGKKK
jgi:hypothetical protein